VISRIKGSLESTLYNTMMRFLSTQKPNRLLYIIIVSLMLLLLSITTPTNGNRYVAIVDARATTTTPPRTRSTVLGQKSSTSSIYRWGNLGNERKIRETNQHKLTRHLKLARIAITDILNFQLRIEQLKDQLKLGKLVKFGLRCFRTWVFYYFSKDCFDSIYEDRWHAERNPEDFFGGGGMWISKGGHKEVVRKRMQRGKRNRQWVGLGYTPRLVWLVGVLMKGTFACTSVEKVFNPSITSWGAGTVLGAKCTHQEWISAFMLGWYGSEYYWKLLFGCAGPPSVEGGFEGIPISISKIRFGGKVEDPKRKWYVI